jgi:hypothetical protein
MFSAATPSVSQPNAAAGRVERYAINVFIRRLGWPRLFLAYLLQPSPEQLSLALCAAA